MGLDLGIDHVAELDGSHESGETEDYFAARRRAHQEPYRAEGMVQGVERGIEQGIERGIEQGLSAKRDLLCRQAACKFDARTAARLPRILADIHDPEGLAQAGELVVDCAGAEELIGRLASMRGSRECWRETRNLSLTL